MSDDNSDQIGEIVLKQDGGYALPENWRETLSEELQEDPTLKDITDLPGMAKMLVNSQKMIGKDKIVVPGEGASEEQWDEIFTKLGRPETPEEYGLDFPEGWSPEIAEQASPEMLKEFSGLAHKIGLLPGQTKQLFDWYNERYVEGYEADANNEKAQIDATEQKLRQKYGAAYPEKVEQAKRLFLSATGEENREILDKKYGNDAFFIEFCAAVGEWVNEDKLKGGRGPSWTPSEAKATLDGIMGNTAHPYFHKNKPGHAEAVRQVQLLNDAIYGTEPVAKADVHVGG